MREKVFFVWNKKTLTRDMCVLVGTCAPKKQENASTSSLREKINFILISCDLIKKDVNKTSKSFYGLKSKQMEYLIFISWSFLRSVVMHFCALYAFTYRGKLRKFGGWKVVQWKSSGWFEVVKKLSCDC